MTYGQNEQLQWTLQALDCLRQKTCKGCTLREFCLRQRKHNKGTTPMKNSVQILLQKLGKPTPEIIKNLCERNSIPTEVYGV